MVKHMTQLEDMRSNTIQTLQYLDTQLPKGSHVLLIGLGDGRFLWDNLHDKYHPIGNHSSIFSFFLRRETDTVGNDFKSVGLLKTALCSQFLPLSSKFD